MPFNMGKCKYIVPMPKHGVSIDWRQAMAGRQPLAWVLGLACAKNSIYGVLYSSFSNLAHQDFVKLAS